MLRSRSGMENAVETNHLEIRLAALEEAESVARIPAVSFMEYRSQHTAEAFRATVLSP